MNLNRNGILTMVGLIALMLGMGLSTLIEAGVRVERLELPGETPALKFSPDLANGSDEAANQMVATASGSGRNAPVALLAHGITASKETLFRVGEALAAAGFVSYIIDFSGHGGSSRRFVPATNVTVIEKALQGLPGHPEIFVGHSMGAYAGAGAVRAGTLRPKLFAAIGALPTFDNASCPLLLLAVKGRLFSTLGAAKNPPPRCVENEDRNGVEQS